MNDKDKEAFSVWGVDQDGNKPLLEGSAYEAWQAACEYKDSDKELLRDNMNTIGYNELKKLQIENKKLREALNRISEIGYYHDYGIHIDIAIEALKEVEDK